MMIQQNGKKLVHRFVILCTE